MALPPSRWANLEGPVHYVDYGGPDGGPLLVCVHGLGGSLVSWAAVAPALARTSRVLAVDLAGFGRTPGSPRPVTVPANQALLHSFLLQVAGTPAILVGHSMGGTIAAMQASEHPDTTAGLVLINPAVPWQLQDQINPKMAGLFAGLALLAAKPAGQSGHSRVRAVEQMLRDAVRERYEHAAQIPTHVIEQNLAAARARLTDGRTNGDMLAAARSLTWTLAHRSQFATVLRSVLAPVLMLHGDRDRFVPIGAARATARANPGWRFHIAHDIGHVPQLEAPQWTIDHIMAWLHADGAAAVEQARTARLPTSS